MAEVLKILIIDDSEDDRVLYRRTLQKSTETSYGVSDASDGDEGLRYLRGEQPACVLLDYSLPGRNGIEVLKRIRSNYPFLPIIMLTGQGNENVAVSAMQCGAQNYIVKSTITLEALEHVIHMAAEHCKLQKRVHDQRTALEVFTRALAHDLNEPVRTIRSFIELVGQSSLTEKAKGYCQHIQNAADRMHMLINTVFLYTRLDNTEQITKEICDLNDVLKEVKENIDQLIKERCAVIESRSLPKVYANRAHITQLLQNIICNSINHSDTPVKVDLRAVAKDDYWVISIRDNGPGIEAANLQKIFDPFKRMSVRHAEQGSGLGLAICKKIVESQGGKIWCESEVGYGSTFLFTFSRELPIVEEKPSFIAATRGVNGSKKNDRPLANILLVDDSRADIDIMRFRLIERSHLQCNLLIARNGEEALSMMHEESQANRPIDLVLLDINMPEMDGFETLEKMRAEMALQKVSVVMCTGSNYDKDMERAKMLGAIGYLTKPIEFSKLKSVIDKISNVQLCQEADSYALRRAVS